MHVRENGAHHSRWEQSGLKKSAVQFTAFYLKDTGSSVHSILLKDTGLRDPPHSPSASLNKCVYCSILCVCVYYCSTYYKAVRGGGGGWRVEDMCYGARLLFFVSARTNKRHHHLRETTSRGQCELVCPSCTSELGGEGYCVKGGGEEEGERERERAGRVRIHYSLAY